MQLSPRVCPAPCARPQPAPGSGRQRGRPAVAVNVPEDLQRGSELGASGLLVSWSLHPLTVVPDKVTVSSDSCKLVTLF